MSGPRSWCYQAGVPDRGCACKCSARFSLFLCCGILVSLCEAADIGWSCEDLHSAWECFSLLQHKSDPLQPLAPYTPAQSQPSKTPSVRPQGKSELLAQPTRPPQAAQLGQSCFLLFPRLAYAGSHLSGFIHTFPPPWMPSALTPLTVFSSFQIPPPRISSSMNPPCPPWQGWFFLPVVPTGLVVTTVLERHLPLSPDSLCPGQNTEYLFN